VSEQLDDIRTRLDVIAEELADLALDRLQQSISEGSDASEERRITRARRAVEKAAAVLGQGSRGDDSQGSPGP